MSKTKRIPKIPINLNKTGCSPISSNCVKWQGPDVPCLSLCKGDSITEVVYELAVNFCDVYQHLSPETYNADCLLLNNECQFSDFGALFQALIDKVCELEGNYCNIVPTINNDTATTFSTAIENGVAPYQYEWSVVESEATGVILSSNPSASTAEIDFTRDGNLVSLLKVKVTDKNGCIGTDTMLIYHTV
jgi:hypothetical protein